MKIEGNRPAIDTNATDATQQVSTPQQQRANRAGGRPSASRDSVEVSADAKLLSNAMKVASDTPDIRTDVVERMKQKLANGEIGNDPGQLADAMLDDVLKK
jgi:negative regulator of flagellin synthesis FlgM